MPVVRFSAQAPEEGAGELRLRFAPSRTQVLRVVSDTADLAEAALHQSAFEVRLAPPRGFAPRQEVAFALEYRGEAPSHPHYDFLPASPFRLLLGAPLSIEQSLRQWKDLIDEEGRDTLARYDARISDEIAKESDARVAGALKFFWHLEKETNSLYLRLRGDAALATDVVAFSEALVERLRQRMANPGSDPTSLAGDPRLHRFADIMSGVIRKELIEKDPDNWVALFDDAFVLFASGKLSRGSGDVWNARPDSAYFFLFAEFAFAAAQAGLGPWKQLIRTLVHTEYLFYKVFRPYCSRTGRIVEEGQRHFYTYRGQDPRDVVPDHVVAALAAMRNELDTNYTDLQDLHLRFARAAFRFGAGADDACDILDGVPSPPQPIQPISITPMTSTLTAFLKSAAHGPMANNREDELLLRVEPSSWAVDGVAPSVADNPKPPIPAGHTDIGPAVVVYDVSDPSWLKWPKVKGIRITPDDTTFISEGVMQPTYGHDVYDVFVVIAKRG